MWHRFIPCCTGWRNAAGSAADGSRKPGSVDVAITASRRPGERCWPRSGKAGASFLKRSAALRGSSMPDFKNEIQARMRKLGLAPTREHEIVEELSQHLEEEFEHAVSRGASEADATRTALSQLGDLLGHGLQRIERPAPQNSIRPGTRQKSNFVADVAPDMRYALRMFGKN